MCSIRSSLILCHYRKYVHNKCLNASEVRQGTGNIIMRRDRRRREAADGGATGHLGKYLNFLTLSKDKKPSD